MESCSEHEWANYMGKKQMSFNIFDKQYRLAVMLVMLCLLVGVCSATLAAANGMLLPAGGAQPMMQVTNPPEVMITEQFVYTAVALTQMAENTPTPTPFLAANPPSVQTPLPTATAQPTPTGTATPEVYGHGFFVFPVADPWISGYRFTPPIHNGLDFGGSYGTPILAADRGKVIFSGWSWIGYGCLVILDHGNGFTSYYAHMIPGTLAPLNSIVEQGEMLGKMGSTGYSTGTHLHFELRLNDQPMNPWMLMLESEAK